MSLQQRKSIFKRNIRYLAGWLNMNLRELAEASELGESGYRWLRRSTALGIHGRASNNEEYLKKLARFFKKKRLLTSYKDFWSSSLSKEVVGREIVKATGLSLEISDEEALTMFAELLSAGGYDYLKTLVHDLHSRSASGSEGTEEEDFERPNKPR